MKPLLVVWGLTCAGDPITTHHILTHGGREAWLPTQSPVLATSISAGTCVAGLVSIAHLAKDHPKAAKIVGWTLVGLRGSVVLSNIHQIQAHAGGQ
jgi:hypothetical protein